MPRGFGCVGFASISDVHPVIVYIWADPIRRLRPKDHHVVGGYFRRSQVGRMTMTMTESRMGLRIMLGLFA